MQEEAYPPEYYGSATKKFLPGLEALSHRPPVLLEQAERFARDLAADGGRSPAVLDVGCGRGYLLKRLQREGWSCAGIDIPGSPIPEGGAGLDCRFGDACSLPWADESFDLVVINHVLEHVPDPWLACREAARVLCPGGVLYIGVPNFGSWQRRIFGRYWFPLEIPRHLYHFSPRNLEICVAQAGFEKVAVSTWSLSHGVFGFLQSALNAADPAHKDLLLALTKGQRPAGWGRSFVHLAAACLMVPVALAETVLASLFGCGPIIAMVFKRPNKQDEF